MNLLTHIRTVVAFLRGSEAVTTQEFKLALSALVRAGLDWWVDLSGPPLATACPCDPDNRASCADFLEAQARLCEGGAVTVGADAGVPWNIVLPLLIELIQRWLGR